MKNKLLGFGFVAILMIIAVGISKKDTKPDIE